MAVDELESLSVHGTRQWLLCRGNDRGAALVLFVHGGPGSPLMYFSRAFDAPFLKDFVVAHWDQRSSGKSYDPKEPPETFSLEQVAQDGIRVAEHLGRKFSDRPLILVGHSWGSMVAARMAVLRPDLFRALVSVGTVSDMPRSDEIRFRFLQELASRAGADAVAEAARLGPPPYASAERIMSLGDLIMKHGGFNRTFRQLTPEQLNDAVMKNREYSAEELEGSVTAMKAVLSQVAGTLREYVAIRSVARIEVPIHFVHGVHDINTPYALAEEYFRALDAPAGKRWIAFADSAHFPMYEDPKRFLAVLEEATRAPESTG